jgi:hypothetical protein
MALRLNLGEHSLDNNSFILVLYFVWFEQKRILSNPDPRVEKTKILVNICRQLSGIVK